MAELLIRAKGHWMDEWDATKVASLTEGELQSYNARTQIGDIIVVRPDGWTWGKEECLPNFIVVKLPNLTEADVKHYEQQLYDNTDPLKPIMLKVRKYRVPPTYVNNLVSLNQSVVTIAIAQIGAFRGTIIEKVS